MSIPTEDQVSKVKPWMWFISIWLGSLITFWTVAYGLKWLLILLK